MNRPFTIYFDTNFFVWLTKASEDLANFVIQRLNELRIRHVLSDMLMRELLSCANKPEEDAVLVSRVSRLGLEPYLTNQYLCWSALLSSGPLRQNVANLFVGIDDMLTEANSHSIMANRFASGKLTAEQFEELSNATTPFLDEIGFSPNQDPETNLRALQAFVDKLGELLPEGSCGLKLSDNPEEDSQRLMDLLEPNALNEAKESSFLTQSTTATENRPYLVTTGRADANIRRNLGHTLRDSEHMKTFVLHSAEIDLLQVDRAQMNLIKAKSPIHRLSELGLAERCFTASSLNDVLEVIERMMPT
jgi:hypothetical protein